MIRLIHRPITVTLRKNERHTFIDDGFTHTIQTVIDEWQEVGAWWEGESSHHIYRVVTVEDYMYDIERMGDEWSIYRVWD